jgi:hypothetical protein
MEKINLKMVGVEKSLLMFEKGVNLNHTSNNFDNLMTPWPVQQVQV